jgi:hypothetical protein
VCSIELHLLANNLRVLDSLGFPAIPFSAIFQLNLTINHCFHDFSISLSSRAAAALETITNGRPLQERLIATSASAEMRLFEEFQSATIALNEIAQLPTQNAK